MATEEPPQKKARKTPPMGRAWCYTLNNYSEEDLETLRELDAVVHFAGLEVGESGTPHVQGYVRFVKPCRLSWWKTFMPRAHVELRYKSETQAANYAIKDGKILVQKGRLSDGRKYSTKEEETEVVMDKIDEGKSYTEIRAEHRAFAFWYRRNIFDYMMDHRTITRGEDPFDLQAQPTYKS